MPAHWGTSRVVPVSAAGLMPYAIEDTSDVVEDDGGVPDAFDARPAGGAGAYR